MKPIRIAHTADLHLGSALQGLGRNAKKRSAEIVHTFFDILQKCEEKQVQILLIAGDFLESSEILPGVVQSIKEEIERHPSVRIFISPGNHDYISLGSPYMEHWPHNVHIFRGNLEAIRISEWNVVVYGGAFQGTYQEQSLLTSMDWAKERADTENDCRLLVLHADWNHKTSSYHPLMPEDLPSDFFTYVALGHIHQRSPLYMVGRTVVSYSGCPDGRGFDETEEKGIYLGNVSPFSAQLEFVPFSSRLFRRCMVDTTECSTLPEAQDAIRRAMMDGVDTRRYPLSDLYARIYLTGFIPRKDFSVSLLQESLQGEVYDLELLDRREPAVNWDLLRQEESLRGYFAQALYQRLEKAQENGDAAEERTIRRAFRLGMDAMDGKELPLADYANSFD